MIGTDDVDRAVIDRAPERLQKSKCGWTPFDGLTVTGWPVMTVIRGDIVMRDGELAGEPVGRPVRFREALKS